MHGVAPISMHRSLVCESDNIQSDRAWYERDTFKYELKKLHGFILTLTCLMKIMAPSVIMVEHAESLVLKSLSGG